jgi:hypothetical protein
MREERLPPSPTIVVGYWLTGDSYSPELELHFSAMTSRQDPLLGTNAQQMQNVLNNRLIEIIFDSQIGYRLRPRRAGTMSRNELLNIFFNLNRSMDLSWQLRPFD